MRGRIFNSSRYPIRLSVSLWKKLCTRGLSRHVLCLSTTPRQTTQYRPNKRQSKPTRPTSLSNLYNKRRTTNTIRLSIHPWDPRLKLPRTRRQPFLPFLRHRKQGEESYTKDRNQTQPHNNTTTLHKRPTTKSQHVSQRTNHIRPQRRIREYTRHLRKQHTTNQCRRKSNGHESFKDTRQSIYNMELIFRHGIY